MVFALFWRSSLTGARLGRGDTPLPRRGQGPAQSIVTPTRAHMVPALRRKSFRRNPHNRVTYPGIEKVGNVNLAFRRI